MPTPSKHQSALENIVTTLAAVTPDATYYTDLSGSGQVSHILRDHDAMMDDPFRVWIWVHEGREDFTTLHATERDFMATLEILLDVLVTASTADAMLVEMAKVRHDIHLAVGADPTLGGAGVDAHISSIDTPEYNMDERTGVMRCTVTVLYDFTAGSTI